MEAYRLFVKDWSRKGRHCRIIRVLADCGFAVPTGRAYAAKYENDRTLATEITDQSDIEVETIEEAVSIIYNEFPDDEFLEVSYEAYEKTDVVKMPRFGVVTSSK